ncbi:hypothetical protein EB118_16805, partial [bacterium]|nr:hypothetical protein [bacterium]
ITCTVTASNLAGSASSTTAATIKVPGLTPSLTAAPTLTGTNQVFETLNTTSGTWFGTATIGYAYQWQRNGVNINTLPSPKTTQGTSNSYTLTAADYQATIRVIIYAFNTGGETSTTVTFSGQVLGKAPIITAIPTISGTVAPASTITASTGTWTAVPAITSYSYQWRADGVNISGATSASYTVALADIGKKLSCLVTATNSVGSIGEKTADTITVPNATAPSNTAGPTISGSFVLNGTVTATTGSWNGTPPITYTIQWYRSPADGSGVLGTGSNYIITMADTNQKIYARVIANNPGGTQQADSSLSGTIPAVAPTNTVAPTISGTAAYNNTLSVTTGTWTGSTGINYTYQWRVGTTNIAGATGSSYTLNYDQTNTTVNVQVTATNAGGSNTATTTNYPSSGVIPAIAPINSAPPTYEISPDATTYTDFSGSSTIRVGDVVRVKSPGTWVGSPTITFSYTWGNSDGTAISSPFPNALIVPDTSYGKTLVGKVTGTNPGGSTVYSTTLVTVVNQLIRVTTNPDMRKLVNSIEYFITSLNVGDVVRITSGDRAGFPTPTISMKIQALFSGVWTDIATNLNNGAYYTIPSNAYNTQVRVSVTATNAFETVTREFNPGVTVGPQNLAVVVAPSITLTSGALRPGGVLSWNAGTYSGTPQPNTFSVILQRLISGVSSDIATYTTSTGTYTIVNADYNSTLRIKATVGNGGVTPSITNDSQYTNNIGPLPIGNTALPTITTGTATTVAGDQKYSTTYNVSLGSWTGWPALSYTLSLYRGTTLITSSTGTSLSYQLTASDYQQTHYATVKATNAADSTGVTATSATTSAFNTTVSYTGSNPSITASGFDPSSILRDGQVIRVDQPLYTKIPAPTVTYQWRRGTTNISGATGSSYTVTASDIGSAINCVVTYSGTPTETRTTGNTATVQPALVAPSWTSTPDTPTGLTVQNTITLPTYTASGNPTPTITTTWQRAEAATPTSFSNVSGSSVTLVTADYGRYYRISATASNSQGSISYTSTSRQIGAKLAQPDAFTMSSDIAVPDINSSTASLTLSYSANAAKLNDPTPATYTETTTVSLHNYDDNNAQGLGSLVQSWSPSIRSNITSMTPNTWSLIVSPAHYGKVLKFVTSWTTGYGVVGGSGTTTLVTNRIVHGPAPTATMGWSTPIIIRVGDPAPVWYAVISYYPPQYGAVETKFFESKTIAATTWTVRNNTNTLAITDADIGLQLRGRITLTLPAMTYKAMNYSTGQVSSTTSTAPAWNVEGITQTVSVFDKAISTAGFTKPTISGNYLAGSVHTINAGTIPSYWHTMTLFLDMSNGTTITVGSANSGGQSSITMNWTAVAGTISTIRAVWYNKGGEGWANSNNINQVIITATAPGAPGVSIYIDMNWPGAEGRPTFVGTITAPSSNGGAAITSYKCDLYKNSGTYVSTQSTTGL